MRILMISMFAGHFFNWVDQLKDSDHEVHWIDVFDNGSKVQSINWIHQTVNWKRKYNYPGRYLVKKNLPFLYKKLEKYTERKLSDIVEKKIQEIKPDVIQSFVLFSACAPILGVMTKYPHLKWIYSAWGNDLYYFKNEPEYLRDIKRVLPRVNYMFADCYRDYTIAKEFGFKGEFLGVFPGGGGYIFRSEDKILSVNDRKIILVKGYQKLFGECKIVLEALVEMQQELTDYEIVVFGADEKALEFIQRSEIKNFPNFKMYKKIGRPEVMRLMGSSLIYFGNSTSDGMPNTLLEAMIMGAFPIQSNPGNATAELINDGQNGLLIEDPFSKEEIKKLLRKALQDKQFIQSAIDFNFENIKPKLEREKVKERVLRKYKMVETSLNN